MESIIKEDIVHNKEFLYNPVSLSFNSLYNHLVNFPIYAGHNYKFTVYGTEGKCIIKTADANESIEYIEILAQEISVGETTIVKSSNNAIKLVAADSSIIANNIFIFNDKGNKLNASGKAIISSDGENIIKDNLLIKTVDCPAVISKIN